MYEKISKYRDGIMGFAICWVVLFHSKIVTSVSQINFFKTLGYGGVDLFLLVSGFGLYFSLKKNNDTLSFYARRIKKIVPAYFPILFVWMYLKIKGNPSLDIIPFIIGNLTGIAFWAKMPSYYNWYIQAIVVFYLLTPLFFLIIETNKRKNYVLLFILLLLINPCYFNDKILYATSRFPVFIIGMFMGKKYCKKVVLSKFQELFMYLCGCASLVFLSIIIKHSPELLTSYGFWWYPFILLAPAITFLLCRIFSLFQRNKGGNIYTNFLLLLVKLLWKFI